jgi:hypothetical protein
MVEQAFNSVQAMEKLKRVFKERSKALVDIFRNKWRHKHLLYQVLTKVFRKTRLIKYLVL